MKNKKTRLFAFISYKNSENLIAGKIKEILSEYGIDSFLAHKDIAVSRVWQEEILKNIKLATLFICILSKKYLESGYCMQESGMAEILNIPIIPLSYDGTTSPGFISKYQSKKINQAVLNNLRITVWCK